MTYRFDSEMNLLIENEYYQVLLKKDRGYSMMRHVFKNCDGYSPIRREGCEIYWSKVDTRVKGKFKHYEQECAGNGNVWIMHATSQEILVKTDSRLANPTLRKPYGYCVNNWVFKANTPVIQVNFMENHQNMAPKDSKLWFKRYIASAPRLFNHWAYATLDGKIIEGDVDSSVNRQIPNISTPKWITFYNEKAGFTMFPLDPEPWKNGIASIWRSEGMQELIYAVQRNTQIARLNMAYLGYATPIPHKWVNI